MNADEPGGMTPPSAVATGGAAPTTLIAAGAMLEAPVLGSDGKVIGKIADVMVEGGTGRIAYVVVACGGVLGIGEALHAVAWHDVKVDPENGRLSLDIGKLDPTKAFDKDHWPIMLD